MLKKEQIMPRGGRGAIILPFNVDAVIKLKLKVESKVKKHMVQPFMVCG